MIECGSALKLLLFYFLKKLIEVVFHSRFKFTFEQPPPPLKCGSMCSVNMMQVIACEPWLTQGGMEMRIAANGHLAPSGLGVLMPQRLIFLSLSFAAHVRMAAILRAGSLLTRVTGAYQLVWASITA